MQFAVKRDKSQRTCLLLFSCCLQEISLEETRLVSPLVHFLLRPSRKTFKANPSLEAFCYR